MSLYRHALVEGKLVRQKRSPLLFWKWRFNRCEEDRLTAMQNQVLQLRMRLKQLAKQIPFEEKRVKKMKEDVQTFQSQTGKPGGPPFRDGFSFRKEPVLPLGEVKMASKKGERKFVHQKAPTLARLVVGDDKVTPIK